MKDELTRRDFLRVGTTTALASGMAAVSARGEIAETANAREEDMVPDTLDLADRGRLAVNALTEILDPKHRYMNYHFAEYYANPAYMSHMDLPNKLCLTGNELWGKGAEDLIMMRVMSGSDQNADFDEKTLQGMVSCIGPDNLYWKEVAVIQGDQAVRSPADDNAVLYTQARVILALLAQHRLDQDPKWVKLVQRLGEGLISTAIFKDDYAYYPFSDVGGSLNMPRSGWKTKDEPPAWSMCDKGWYFSASDVEFSQGGIVRASCGLYSLTGDEKTLDFAGKLVKFMLKDRMWQPEAEPKAVVSAQHAHFAGHIHAVCWGLWGLLDYAELTNDTQIKAFVRDGYEYIRNFGISRVGLFAEGCTVGDMTDLAIRLSDTGVGDYWEDVDQYVRNHLVEIQLLRPDVVRKISEASPAHKIEPWETSDRVIEKNVGALFADATHLTTATPGGIYCCTDNGLLAYYHAWKSIVQFRDGVAQVNLLLNRTSPWLDVASYLPYEGKVVLRNKTAKRVSIRVPGWVGKGKVKSTINGRVVNPFWVGRYLVFESVGKGDVLALKFPMVETTETYENGFEHAFSFPGHTEQTCVKEAGKLTRYTLHFRGNTVVDVGPRVEVLGYPMYERDHMKADKAPMKKKDPYVATKIV